VARRPAWPVSIPGLCRWHRTIRFVLSEYLACEVLWIHHW
jgi:hypothetical protein